MKQNKTTEEKISESALVDHNGQHLIRLSTGVVLRAKPVPPLAFIKTAAAFPRPKPPLYFNEKMGREMVNDQNPEYIEELKAYRAEGGNALLVTLITYGTELAECPKGFPKPNDDTWLEQFAEIGLEMKPHNEFWRYITWVQVKAVGNEEDLAEIQKVVSRLTGVPEDAVEAAESFPGSRQNGGV